MENIINLIVSNGFAVVIVAYFLWKDYKFNNQIISVLTELKTVLSTIARIGTADGSNS